MQGEHNRAGPVAVVLDPHPLYNAAVGTVLQRVGVSIAASATTADRALRLLDKHQPDLFVIEVAVPAGLECLRRARASHPQLTAIVVSATDDARTVDAAHAAGAAAFIPKCADAETLARAVARVLANGQNGSAPTHAPAPIPTRHFTRRELEILGLVAQGLSNADVAKLLWVTAETVKFHLANVYRKLGVGNRHDAVRVARERTLLPADADEGMTNGDGDVMRGGELTRA